MVTIHCSVVKQDDTKRYYGHISDDLGHDQSFVNQVLVSVIQGEIKHSCEVILVHSDNCTSQYKSAESFYDLQNLSNNFGKTVIRVYGVAGHGKSEVDSIGGILKIAVRRAVSCGSYFEKSSDITKFLTEKFNQPLYVIEEVDSADLGKSRLEAKLHKYLTVHGSSRFQVVVFTPGSEQFKACNFHCFCIQCSLHYGSCKNFKTYKLDVQPSSAPGIIVPDLEREEHEADIDLSQSLCIAEDADGGRYVAFVLRAETYSDKEPQMDCMGNSITTGEPYLRSCLVELIAKNDSASTYSLESRPRKKLFLTRDNIKYSMLEHTKEVRKQKVIFTVVAKYYDDVINFIEEFESI